MRAFTTKDGLLYCNGEPLNTQQADAAANEFGFPYAEQFVRHIQAGVMPGTPMKFQVQELRPEVMAFALLMEKRLREKDADKGQSWKNAYMPNLQVAVVSKTNQLATIHFDHIEANRLLSRHAVDLANYCMMISDLAGALKQDVPSQEPMEIPAFLRMYRDE